MAARSWECDLGCDLGGVISAMLECNKTDAIWGWGGGAIWYNLAHSLFLLFLSLSFRVSESGNHLKAKYKCKLFYT